MQFNGKELVWNVYWNDYNSGAIRVRNIFNLSCTFKEDILKILNTNYTKKEFTEKVYRSLMYSYWSKFEYEVIITEFTSKKEKAERKVDIFSQVHINFEPFIDYLWNIKEGN